MTPLPSSLHDVSVENLQEQLIDPQKGKEEIVIRVNSWDTPLHYKQSWCIIITSK